MFDKSPLFMQNKPNFGIAKMKITTYTIMRYVNLGAWREEKTNPIQTQSNPIKANFGPKSRGSKPNKAKTNPIKAT